jgi:hypothetical protein
MHKELPERHHHDVQILLATEPQTPPITHIDQSHFIDKRTAAFNGPPPSLVVADIRFKRPPPNPASREPSLSATTEEGFGASEMSSNMEHRALLTSRSKLQELNNIAHPNLDPTLTARLEQTTLLMRTPRAAGPYSEKLKKKKKGYWYIHGQEPREDKGQQQQRESHEEPDQKKKK